MNRLLVFVALLFVTASCLHQPEYSKDDFIRPEVIKDMQRAREIALSQARLSSIWAKLEDGYIALGDETFEFFEGLVIDEMVEEKGLEWKKEYYQTSDQLDLSIFKVEFPPAEKGLEISTFPAELVLSQVDYTYQYQNAEGLSADARAVLMILDSRIRGIALSERDRINLEGTFNNQLVVTKTRNVILEIEDGVLNNQNISASEAQIIFETTTTLLASLDQIMLDATAITLEDRADILGRGTSFWNCVWRYTKRVVAFVAAAVVTVAVVGAGLIGGFALCGAYCAAAGGVLGAIGAAYLAPQTALLIDDTYGQPIQ